MKKEFGEMYLAFGIGMLLVLSFSICSMSLIFMGWTFGYKKAYKEFGVEPPSLKERLAAKRAKDDDQPSLRIEIEVMKGDILELNDKVDTLLLRVEE